MDYLLLILGLYLSWWLLQAFLYISNRSTSSQAGKLPPGPRPLPVIGNLLELGSQPHRSLAKLAATHGPIMTLKLGRVTTVIVSSAPMAREILQTHDGSFPSRMSLDVLMAFRHNEQGIFWIPASPLWRSLRRTCNVHLFAPKTLDSNEHLRAQKIEELLALVAKCNTMGVPVDIGEAAFTTMLNLLSNTLLSVDLADPATESGKEFRDIVCRIMVEAGKPNLADYFPALKRFDPQGARRNVTRCFRRLLDVFEKIIRERVGVGLDVGKNDDVLGSLLKDGMDVVQIKHLFLDLFIAGADTASSTLEWAMAELLRHPNKLLKAQVELDNVIGRDKIVQESDIARLPYLQAIAKETFRMHPAGPILTRKAGAKVEVGGYAVPEGTHVLVNVWAICRDPATWRDPDEFTPERFLGSNVDVKGQDFELLPFGGGRRMCPGLPLAMRMLHAMLGSLLNSFDWRLEDGVSPATMDIADTFGITLKKAQPLRAVPLSRDNL